MGGESDLGLIRSQNSAMVIDRVTREKDEIELEVRQLTESLRISRDQEALMRAKVLKLEERIGVAAEKEEETARKYNALLIEKKEMEKSFEVLTKRRGTIYSVLDIMVQRELENKRREFDVANRARDEIEHVKISHEFKIAELQGELGRVKDVVDELKGSFTEFKEKNEELLSQVHHYWNAFGEGMFEKDNMRKGFDEEKNKVEKLKLQVAGMEERIGVASDKEEEMARKYSALVSEKKEMEKSIEVLTEKRDSVCRVLDNKQHELDEANRARDEIEQVKVSKEYEIAELLGEVSRVRDVMDELKGSHRELEEKNEQLLSQVHYYRNVVDEVMLAKDNMRKGFEEEKYKVENLELQVSGLKEKLEQAEAKLGQMRNEGEKLNERNKELESNVGVLKKEKGSTTEYHSGGPTREC